MKKETSFVNDENVCHVGTEIYSHLGIICKIFEFNFNLEEMMIRYHEKIP